MRLIEVSTAFATDAQCLHYLEQKRWPNGVRCLDHDSYPACANYIRFVRMVYVTRFHVLTMIIERN